MACAWLPKATVQAALGGNILEKAKEEDNAEYINFGNKILTISILSILVTSPPCAISTLSLLLLANIIQFLEKSFYHNRKHLMKMKKKVI